MMSNGGMTRPSRSRHYSGSKPVPEQPEEIRGPVCPLSRQKCLTRKCALWDEDWDGCTMGALSLYNQIRDAATDAMVDIMTHYRE